MSAPLSEHDCRLLIEKLAALHADQLRVIELQRATLSVMDAAAALRRRAADAEPQP